jgi:hypothetical protein
MIMAIEFPSKPDVWAKPAPDVLADTALDERLALLEAAFLADHVLHEGPALVAPEPPRTAREILAWTTRRFGPALIAVTAALSVATGYVITERSHAPVAVVAVPQRHAAPAAQPRIARRPPARAAHHASSSAPAAVAQHHAGAPAAHHTTAAPVVVHAHAQPVVYHAAEAPVVRRPAAHRQSAPARHTAPAVVTHTAPATPQTASEQLAAWERTHPASQGRASATTSAEPAPQTRPRSEPASATDTATAGATRTDPTTTSAPGGATDTGPNGTRTPPSNPGGIWNERLPGGGTLGGAIGPIIGVPRDSCTPRGGRTGIVMQAISILASSHQH